MLSIPRVKAFYDAKPGFPIEWEIDDQGRKSGYTRQCLFKTVRRYPWPFIQRLLGSIPYAD